MSARSRGSVWRLTQRWSGAGPAREDADSDAGTAPFRYRAAALTSGAPHVRDAFSFSRWTAVFAAALVPSLLVGLYNTGYQAGEAVSAVGAGATLVGRGELLARFGIQADPSKAAICMLVGLTYFLPAYLVAVLVADGWERVFAATRRRVRIEGLVVTTLLFTLSLPPTVPLWQVAVGMSFGVVMGKEIFGGAGRTFLNPALVGLVFLYFAYPETLRAPSAWIPVEGWAGGTLLDRMAVDGDAVLATTGVTWADTLLGRVPGGFGDRSVAACTLGAAVLLSMRVVSWRILAGGLFGLVLTAVVFGRLAPDLTPLAGLAWYWHATLGSFAFGLVFLATDPATAPLTTAGRWVYGALIGTMTVVIRVANPAHADGVLLAILLGNVSAPLIDHFVIRANVRRRARRHG